MKVMESRLCLLNKHDAILLLHHYIATPRVLYTLRTAPCFQSPCLEDFDLELRSILSTVLNINLDNDLVWSQATLPVRKGEIGVRRATQLVAHPSSIRSSHKGSTIPQTWRLQRLSMYGVEGTTNHLPQLQRTPNRGCGMVHVYRPILRHY